MRPISDILKETGLPKRASETSTPATSSETDVCPYCRGAGYVRIDAPVESPNFSRLVQCSCRRDDNRRRRANELNDVGGSGIITEWTFETFDDSVRGTRPAFEAAKEYADDPYNWLVLGGPYGSGKTHLAAAIVNYARAELEMAPVFAVVPDLLDYLRSTFAPSSEARYEAQFDAIRTASLLVLDDLGTENTTPWAREKLFQIVNYRYMHRLPTVFTTNVAPEDIEGRIRSRMFDTQLSTVIFMAADDYRLRGTEIARGDRRQRRKSS